MDEIDDGLEVIQQEDADESNAKSRMSSGSHGKYSHKQAYRKAWENLPDFKGWLQEVPGEPTRAFCSYCNVTLFAHRLSLLKHTCTMKHQRATQKVWIINNKTEDNDSMLHELPSTSQPVLEPLPVELDLPTSKVNSSLTSGMTVTILQDGEDGVLKLQIQDKITEPENDIMIVEDDLDLDVPLQLSEVTEHSNESEIPAVRTRAPVTQASVMAHSPDFPLSTHVLDTSKGQPVTQLSVSLYRLIDGKWTLVNEGITSDDGRCNKLIKKSEFVAGRYKLHFDTDRYFALERKETLYPFVEIAFDVHAPHDHYHIPLLLSAFGYSTYRGS